MEEVPASGYELVVLLCRSVPLTSGESEEPSAVFLLAVFL